MKAKKKQSGFTLLEAVISAVIAAVIMASVFTFVSFTGETTRIMEIQQRLKQESAVMTEAIIREIRRGQYITSGNNTETNDTMDVTTDTINVYMKDGTATRISFANQKLIFQELNTSGTVVSTDTISYFDTQLKLSSQFTVKQNGDKAEFSLDMSVTDSENKEFTYSITNGNVKCRNWATEEYTDLPDFTPITEAINNNNNTTSAPRSTTSRPDGGGGPSGW